MSNTENSKPEFLGLCHECGIDQPEHPLLIATYWTHLGVMCDYHFEKYEKAFPDRD